MIEMIDLYNDIYKNEPVRYEKETPQFQIEQTNKFDSFSNMVKHLQSQQGSSRRRDDDSQNMKHSQRYSDRRDDNDYEKELNEIRKIQQDLQELRFGNRH